MHTPSVRGRITRCDDYAEFGQQSAGAITDGQDYGIAAFTHAMPGQTHLLVDQLQRNKAHFALPRRRADRLGIVVIMLVACALAERFDELRSHQAWLQSPLDAIDPQ